MNSMSVAFKKVVKDAEKVEQSATQILIVAQKEKAVTIEAFDALVTSACQENNYSQQVGRPAAGSTLEAMPSTLRYYITTMRRIYRDGLDVMSFKSMFEVREAVYGQKGEPKPRQSRGESLSFLRGVKISKDDAMNGAIVHDIGFVMIHLPEDKRELLEAKLETLKKQFAKMIVDGEPMLRAA